MRIYDIIEKKKRGLALSREEIEFFVGGFTGGAIPDYQASALLMAIYFQGMSAEECACLTDAMSRSGEVIDLELFGRHSADKHSSGGVGDKTTLIVAPLAASMGCTVAKNPANRIFMPPKMDYQAIQPIRFPEESINSLAKLIQAIGRSVICCLCINTARKILFCLKLQMRLSTTKPFLCRNYRDTLVIWMNYTLCSLQKLRCGNL